MASMISTPKNARYRRKFSVMLFALVVLIGAQFLLWPFVQSAAANLHNKRTQEQQLINLRHRLKEIDETVHKYDSALENLDGIFPDLAASSQTVEQLEAVAQRRGLQLKIDSIREQDSIASRGPADIVPLTFLMSVTGGSDDLLSYLDDVEHLEEQVVVKTWAIKAILDSTSGTPQLKHQLTMDLTFYLQRYRDGQ